MFGINSLLHFIFALSFCRATILPGLSQDDTPSPVPESPSVISIMSCNGTESRLPTAQYQISHSSNNYHTPTILNWAFTRPSKNSGEEDYMDIGNRISSPLSSLLSNSWGSVPSRVPTTGANRVVGGQNNFIVDDHIQKTMEIENRVKFHLFTRKNPAQSQELKILDKPGVNESHFSPDLETKLIFHGFTDVDAPGEWVNVLAETYLSLSDVNLIVADFSSFSLHNLLLSPSLPLFASKRLTEFMTFLSSETGAPLESFHIIARSHACHISGMSGRQLGGKLGRITALEPSAKIQVVGLSDIKLNPGDAQFVEAIHVNGQRFFFHGAQFGLVPPMGHVDVYPSISEKGLGCPGENMNFRRYSVRFCHLGRGVRYFTKSLRYPHLYPMCRCANFESYKAGLCSCQQRGQMMSLGSITDKNRGVFQLAPLFPMQNPAFPSFPNAFFSG